MGPANFDCVRDTESESFIASIDQCFKAWPVSIWGKDRIVLGVSGGADSILLMHSLATIATNKRNVQVVHCNHGQRGEESDADEAFVHEQADRLGVRYRSFRLSETESQKKSEEALRQARHRYLILAAEEFRASWIALAHHLDDQVETLFHRLLRGTGLRGLSGIPFMRSVFPDHCSSPIQIVRPFLAIPKEEILSVLNKHGILYRNDSSNNDCTYTRNRLRQELFPLLDSIAGAGWRLRVAETMEQCREQVQEREEAVRNKLAYDLKNNCSTNEVNSSLEELLVFPWSCQREYFVMLFIAKGWPLREIGAGHWRRIRSLLDSASECNHPKRMQLPGGIRIAIRKRQISLWREAGKS
ncbi:MAG: tRNA lysidine(34) synthetase TilS [Planctomycetes bacterium]|nr:tRNA lysidine(34) synthetase TilS [Planctomycetota bacterium]